jgi:hypothetical protein
MTTTCMLKHGMMDTARTSLCTNTSTISHSLRAQAGRRLQRCTHGAHGIGQVTGTPLSFSLFPFLSVSIYRCLFFLTLKFK